jgi:hypothetical protein
MRGRRTPGSRFPGRRRCPRPALTCATALLAASACCRAGHADEPPRPQLVTAETKADPNALARLEKPGKVFFADGFESPNSLAKYFEIRGRKDGRARLVTDPNLAHSGKGAIRFTAEANKGRPSGAGASGWFGPKGYDRVYFRRYIRFAADYDQGSLHHIGGGLAAVAGTNRWAGMGAAGKRPKGNDRFTSAFEPWRSWGRYPAPGYMFFYTYWMDMKRDPDGHYWGNMLGPKQKDRIVPPRDRWVCLEHMIRVNHVGKADGELAGWIDGKLYIHYKGIRWRSSDEVKLKRFDIGAYVHKAVRDNTVWYDDVLLSTGYIGPTDRPATQPAERAAKASRTPSRRRAGRAAASRAE